MKIKKLKWKKRENKYIAVCGRLLCSVTPDNTRKIVWWYMEFACTNIWSSDLDIDGGEAKTVADAKRDCQIALEKFVKKSFLKKE